MNYFQSQNDPEDMHTKLSTSRSTFSVLLKNHLLFTPWPTGKMEHVCMDMEWLSQELGLELEKWA